MTDKSCAECGMTIEALGEYHPYAACLMFKACHNSATVRASLDAIREYERERINAAGASEGQAVDWDVHKGNEDLDAWSLRVSFRKACEEMDAIREALGVDEECDYGDMIEKIEEYSAEIAALRERINAAASLNAVYADEIRDLRERIAGMEKDAPKGYVLAPIEPTEEILMAIFRNERDSRRAWRDVIAAIAKEQKHD